MNRLCGFVVACSSRVQDFVSANTGRVKPYTLKLVFAAFLQARGNKEIIERLVGSKSV